MSDYIYIVITRHDDIWLVGPFPSQTAAADYGAVAEHQRWDHDPTWQTIELANTYGLRIEEPDASLHVPEGAYERACVA